MPDSRHQVIVCPALHHQNIGEAGSPDTNNNQSFYSRDFQILYISFLSISSLFSLDKWSVSIVIKSLYFINSLTSGHCTEGLMGEDGQEVSETERTVSIFNYWEECEVVSRFCFQSNSTFQHISVQPVPLQPQYVNEGNTILCLISSPQCFNSTTAGSTLIGPG